jgi:hypothetical protein
MTTPEPMTVEDVTRLLHAAVDAYGADWVDPNTADGHNLCTNTYELDGVTRHCIAGWVLNEHGYDVTGPDEGLLDTLTTLGVEMSPSGYRLLNEAQKGQDTGWPWGQVVRDALARFPEVS